MLLWSKASLCDEVNLFLIHFKKGDVVFLRKKRKYETLVFDSNGNVFGVQGKEVSR